MSSSTNFGLIIHFEFTFIRDFQLFQGTPAWSCPIAWAFRRFDKRGIFTSYKRPLSKLQLYLTQTLFKANFIFQTKGDNIIHVFGLHQWPPEHHSNTFHPLKKRTLHHWHSCKTCTVTWALSKHIASSKEMETSVLKHFTSDFALYSGVLHIPWLHNHGRWHIIVKRNNQAFQWYQFLFS